MSHGIFCELCSTIRDCWDCDAEARITAGCVLSRVKEIQAGIKNVRTIFPCFFLSWEFRLIVKLDENGLIVKLDENGLIVKLDEKWSNRQNPANGLQWLTHQARIIEQILPVFCQISAKNCEIWLKIDEF